MTNNGVNFRSSLPVKIGKKNELGVWGFLKNCIGKELTKITMPIEFNEPLSLIQRLCEYMEYGNLLAKANASSDPVKRMEYVVAFAISAVSGNSDRIFKPFNPLLGETYEMERNDLGFKFIVEQVSHHPPISAFHAMSSSFTFHGFIQPKIKFWGKSLEIKPEGVFTLVLNKFGDTYTWRNVNYYVHNIIVGKLWLDQAGTLEIEEASSGLKAVLDFKASSSSTKDRIIDGFIINNKKEKVKYFAGKWTEYLKSYLPEEMSFRRSPRPSKLSLLSRTLTSGGASTSMDSNDSTNDTETAAPPDSAPSESGEYLWKISPKPADNSSFYNYTYYTLTLNEIRPGMEEYLPRTDSRFRPDIRFYENGDIEEARKEKTRLEEKQRESRNNASKTNVNKKKR